MAAEDKLPLLQDDALQASPADRYVAPEPPVATQLTPQHQQAQAETSVNADASASKEDSHAAQQATAGPGSQPSQEATSSIGAASETSVAASIVEQIAANPEAELPSGAGAATASAEKAASPEKQAAEASDSPKLPSSTDDGFLRFEFGEDDKLLGLRLSPDVPPVVLAVKPESAGGKKGVPVRGAVHMVNGHPLRTPQEKQALGDLLTALKVRPLVLLISDPSVLEPTSPVPSAKKSLAKESSAASSSAAPPPALQEPESGDVGDSSEGSGDEQGTPVSEAKHDGRAAADLALLAQSAPKAKSSPSKSAGSASSPSPGRTDAPKTEGEHCADDGADSGSDSGEESDKDVSADRFDCDMDLIHRAARKAAGYEPGPAPTNAASQGSPVLKGGSSPGGVSQIDDDEALARSLQAQLDAEEAGETGPQHQSPEKEPPPESVDEDEMLAKTLQAEYDALAREEEQIARQKQQAAQAQAQAYARASASSSPPQAPTHKHVPRPEPFEPQVNLMGNLLSEPISKLHDEMVWTARQRKIATFGAACLKVGRNGKSYKRTFWMSEGFLWTDGKGARRIPVSDLIGIHRGTKSEEFDKLKASKGGIFNRSSSKEADMIRANPGICCVLTTSDRTFSLYFQNNDQRDEFVETVAWYSQRLTWA